MAGRPGRSAFGSARKMTSGRWQARYFGPDMTFNSGPTTFRTKGDAQAWLAEERRLISLEQWSSPRDRAIQAAADEESRRARTLSVYAGQSLAARVTSAGAALGPSTKAGYRNSLDVHIVPRFGALPLDEITTAAVHQWRGQLSASGLHAAGAKRMDFSLRFFSPPKTTRSSCATRAGSRGANLADTRYCPRRSGTAVTAGVRP